MENGSKESENSHMVPSACHHVTRPTGLCWNMGHCGHGWMCSGVSGNEKGTLALNLEKGMFGQENPEAGHMGYHLACVFVGKQLTPVRTSEDKIHHLPTRV